MPNEHANGQRKRCRCQQDCQTTPDAETGNVSAREKTQRSLRGKWSEHRGDKRKHTSQRSGQGEIGASHARKNRNDRREGGGRKQHHANRYIVFQTEEISDGDCGQWNREKVEQ